MKFAPAPLAGAYVIEPEPIQDTRGFFARLYCPATFTKHGLDAELSQISMSRNVQRGIVRGLHLQRPPHSETKIVRVTQGAIFDVIVDVRSGSPTFGKWYGTELTAENCRQMYVPKGFAHGFQTLTPTADVLYHISVPYSAEHQDGVLWSDADVAIDWPDAAIARVSERDAKLARLQDFRPIEVPC